MPEIASVPSPCFVIHDMSCGGAQTATLRWASWLPDWVRERASIWVQSWPQGHWPLVALAAERPDLPPILRARPETASRWILSYGSPRPPWPGRFAAILHGASEDRAREFHRGMPPGEVWAVSCAEAARHSAWVEQCRHMARGVLNPPPRSRAVTPPGIERERSGGIHVVFRSRLQSEKGVGILARVLALAPEIRLTVQAGEDETHTDAVRQWQREAVAALRTDAKARGVEDRLRVVGFTPEVDPESLWALRPDVLLLPSQSEGYGLVVAEALDAGIAVAATNVGGIPEAARGRAAMFEWCADLDELARRAVDAIRQAVEMPPAPSDDWAAEGLPALLDLCGANLAPGGAEADVTIGVRCHVGGRLDWLDECMASIAGQTDRGFRTLLCVDGFQTDAAKVAARYGVPFVCTDRQPAMANMSLSFRLGVEACGTRWFKPLDFDDRLFPEYLTRARTVAARDGLDLYASLMRLADADGNLGDVSGWPQNTPIEVLDQANILVNPIPHLSVLMRTEAALAAGNYLPSAPTAGLDDCDLWIRFRKAGCKIGRDSTALVAYRLSPGQSSRQQAGGPTTAVPSFAPKAAPLGRVTATGKPKAKRRPEDPPRVVALVPRYPPHLAGSELYLHGFLRGLVRRGFFAGVVTPMRLPGPSIADLDGVRIRADVIPAHWERVLDEMRPDLILTQCESAPRAFELAARRSLPIVPIIHAEKAVDRLLERGLWGRETGAVFCNDAVCRSAPASPQPATVVWPPLDDARAGAPEGAPVLRRYATLVNLCPDKGGRFLGDLARSCPAIRFLGVAGAYGLQHREALPNIEYRPTAKRIGDVLAETRVLLMPSRRETFGMVAVEAQSQGIPVLAADLPHLRVSLGDGAHFLPLEAGRWAEVLEEFFREGSSSRWSEAAFANAARIRSGHESHMDAAAAFLARLAKLPWPFPPPSETGPS